MEWQRKPLVLLPETKSLTVGNVLAAWAAVCVSLLHSTGPARSGTKGATCTTLPQAILPKVFSLMGIGCGSAVP